MAERLFLQKYGFLGQVPNGSYSVGLSPAQSFCKKTIALVFDRLFGYFCSIPKMEISAA
jgi:hypothetical protein